MTRPHSITAKPTRHYSQVHKQAQPSPHSITAKPTNSQNQATVFLRKAKNSQRKTHTARGHGSSRGSDPIPSICDMDRIALRNGPFRTMKWAESHCEMGRFALRNGPFRKQPQYGPQNGMRRHTKRRHFTVPPFKLRFKLESK